MKIPRLYFTSPRPELDFATGLLNGILYSIPLWAILIYFL